MADTEKFADQLAQQGDWIIRVNGNNPEDEIGIDMETKVEKVSVIDQRGIEDDHAEISLQDTDGAFLSFLATKFKKRPTKYVFTVRVGRFQDDEKKYATIVGLPKIERAKFEETVQIKLKIYSILTMMKNQKTEDVPTMVEAHKLEPIVKKIAKRYGMDHIISTGTARRHLGNKKALKWKKLDKDKEANDLKRLRTMADQLTKWEDKDIMEKYEQGGGTRASNTSQFNIKREIDEVRASMGMPPKYNQYGPVPVDDNEKAILEAMPNLDQPGADVVFSPIEEPKVVAVQTILMEALGDDLPAPNSVMIKSQGEFAKEMTRRMTELADTGDKAVFIKNLKEKTGMGTKELSSKIQEMANRDLTRTYQYDPEDDVRKQLENYIKDTADVPEDTEIEWKTMTKKGDDGKKHTVLLAQMPDGGTIIGSQESGIDDIVMEKKSTPFGDNYLSFESIQKGVGLSDVQMGTLKASLTGDESDQPSKKKLNKRHKAKMGTQKDFEQSQREWIVRTYKNKLFFGKRKHFNELTMRSKVPVYQYHHGNYGLITGKTRIISNSQDQNDKSGFLGLGGGESEDNGDKQKVSASSLAKAMGTETGDYAQDMQNTVKQSKQERIADAIDVRVSDISPTRGESRVEIAQLQAVVAQDIKAEGVKLIGSSFLRADNFVGLDFNFNDNTEDPLRQTKVYLVKKAEHSIGTNGLLETKIDATGKSWSTTGALLRDFWARPESSTQEGGGPFQNFWNFIKNPF